MVTSDNLIIDFLNNLLECDKSFINSCNNKFLNDLI